MKRVLLFLLIAALVPLSSCRGRRGFVGSGPAAGPVVTDGMAAAPQGAPPTAYVMGPDGSMTPWTGPTDGTMPGTTGDGTVTFSADGAMPPGAAPADGAMAGDMPGAMPQDEPLSPEREEGRFLAQQAIEKARQALNAGDVVAAREWYARALEADPTHPEAREGYRNLSDPRGDVSEYLDQQRSVIEVRRQQAAAEVRNYLERGRVLESQDRYEEAIAEYQKALSIVSWYTDTSDFGVTAESVRDLIEQTRYKGDLARRAQRQEQIAAAQAERERELVSERERRLGRVRAYFEQANLAFRRGEYELAREYARAVSREDPHNRSAESLIRIAHDAEHMYNQTEYRRQFDEQWKAVMLDLERQTYPQVATVEFPDDWLSTIARRTPRVVGEEGAQAESESTAAVLAALDSQRVRNIVWEENSLDDVISYLRTVTGLNFYVTPRVRNEKGEEVVITWSGDDISVRNLLDAVITEPYELRWEVRDGVVTVAMADEVRGTMMLRYFDVKDLVVQIRDFVPTEEINLAPSNYTPPEPPELDEPQPIFPGEELTTLIRETIGREGTWEDPATLEFIQAGIIIARNRGEILAQVQGLLDELRANSGLMVSLEVRFLTAEDNFLRDVGVDVRGLGDDSQGIGVPGLGTNAPQDDIFFGSPANPYGVPFGVFPEPSSAGTGNDPGIFYADGADGAYQARVENLFDVLLGNPEVLTGSGGLSFQHTFLDDTQIEVILRAVEKSERIQQVTGTRITVFNTQRANVSVLNQLSYVQDYDVEIAQASNIANPIIRTIQDGVVLDVRPVVSSDLRFVTLELRPTVALLTRPIATFSTSLASGPITASAPVIIQIPELRVSRVRTTVIMPDQGTLLLGGLKFYEQVTAESGVPFLSDIPFLSFLLSRKGHYVNRRNLMVLISAEIVPLEELEPKGALEIEPIPETEYTPVRPLPLPCPPCPSSGVSPCPPMQPVPGPCAPAAAPACPPASACPPIIGQASCECPGGNCAVPVVSYR